MHVEGWELYQGTHEFMNPSLTVYMCMCVCMSVNVSICTHRGKRYSGAIVTSSCEPPDVGARN